MQISVTPSDLQNINNIVYCNIFLYHDYDIICFYIVMHNDVQNLLENNIYDNIIFFNRDFW